MPGDTKGTDIEFSIDNAGISSFNCFGLEGSSTLSTDLLMLDGRELGGMYAAAFLNRLLIVIGIDRHLQGIKTTLNLKIELQY